RTHQPLDVRALHRERSADAQLRGALWWSALDCQLAYEFTSPRISPNARARHRRADGVPRQNAAAAAEFSRCTDQPVRRAVAVRPRAATGLRALADARAGVEPDAAR